MVGRAKMEQPGGSSLDSIPATANAFHKNFSSSVIWITKGTLNAFCSHLISGNHSIIQMMKVSYIIVTMFPLAMIVMGVAFQIFDLPSQLPCFLKRHGQTGCQGTG